MKAILFLALAMTTSTAAYADQLACSPRGQGWGLANVTKNFWYGTGFYYDHNVCMAALNTLTETGSFGVVCGPHPNGSGIYSVYTGELLGTKSFYYKVNVCATAVQWMRDWVVCVPSTPGSIILDLRTRNSSYNFYYSIESCKWASASASPNDNFVCMPADGGSRIVNRRTKETYSSWYPSAEDCYHSLRGQ